MDRRALIIRLLAGPALIVAVFFFLEKTRPFTDVYKPLLLYFCLALPASVVVEKLKHKAQTTVKGGTP